MWRKATCYKSATFAALVVASSLALLTGAQATTIPDLVGAPFGTNLTLPLSTPAGLNLGSSQELSLTGGSVNFIPGTIAGQPAVAMFMSGLSGTVSFGGLSGTYNCNPCSVALDRSRHW